MSETAGRWAAAVDPTVAYGASPSPDSVSCASAGNCTAVGGGVVLSETGGRWGTAVRATLPANASPSFSVQLYSLSCASAGNCSAVGYYLDSSGYQHGLLLTESGGTWAPGVEAALPANARSPDANASLNSVSCGSAGNCSAIGSYFDVSGNRHWLLLNERGGMWAPGVEPTLPANAAPITYYDDALPASVSCASAGNCSAVGTYVDSSGTTQGLLLTESGGTWAPGIEARLPANAAAAPFAAVPGLVSVSCASPGDCTAVGRYLESSGRQRPLLVSESGGTWETGVEATLPANAGPYSGAAALNSVSCTPGGNCSAVGWYEDNYGHTLGLLIGSLTMPSRLRVFPERFALDGRRVNGRCVKQTPENTTGPRCKRPVKVSVRFRLNIAAGITITIKRVLPGRLANGRCVALTAKNRRRRRCTRVVALGGAITKTGSQGANSFAFNGQIGGHRLAAGTYRLTVSSSFGSPQTVTFRIAS